jgi:hypothetical protein
MAANEPVIVKATWTATRRLDAELAEIEAQASIAAIGGKADEPHGKMGTPVTLGATKVDGDLFRAFAAHAAQTVFVVPRRGRDRRLAAVFASKSDGSLAELLGDIEY